MSFKKLIKIILEKDDESIVDKFRKWGGIAGENVNIYGYIDYGHAFLITIGNNVTVSNAAILAHDASTKIALGYSKVGKVIIGNDVFIGYGAIILPNVKIGNKVIVGAGTVVNRDIPDNSVVVGNPAKIIGTYDEYILKNEKLLKEKPCYQTHWLKKMKDEKNRMINEINDIGFDI